MGREGSPPTQELVPEIVQVGISVGLHVLVSTIAVDADERQRGEGNQNRSIEREYAHRDFAGELVRGARPSIFPVTKLLYFVFDSFCYPSVTAN